MRETLFCSRADGWGGAQLARNQNSDLAAGERGSASAKMIMDQQETPRRSCAKKCRPVMRKTTRKKVTLSQFLRLLVKTLFQEIWTHMLLSATRNSFMRTLFNHFPVLLTRANNMTSELEPLRAKKSLADTYFANIVRTPETPFLRRPLSARNFP